MTTERADPLEILESVSIQQRDDSALYNAMTGMGDPAHDSDVHTQVSPWSFNLSKLAIEELYATSWVLQRACTAYPEGSTQKWLDITLGEGTKKDALDDFNNYQERLKVRSIFGTLPVWANIYGGAAGVIIVDDGRLPSEPIDKDNIKTFKSIQMLDRHKIRPDLRTDNNPLDPELYEIFIGPDYMRRLQDLGAGGMRYVHNSRIVRFDGVSMPPDIMVRRTGGWGQSLVDLIWDSFKRYESASKGASNMIAAFDLFVYQMKGLREVSTMDGAEEEVKRRFALLQLSMSTFNGLIMDSEEKAEFISRNFSGISDILDHIRSELIGATGIPHTILFGESPSGLGATGEAEERTWANLCSSWQETKLRPGLTYIYDLIWRAKDGPTKGEVPDDWGFSFQSLMHESRAEMLTNRSSQSNIDNTYYQAQILLPEEIRASRFGSDQYSYETTLDQKLYDQKQKEAAAAAAPPPDPYAQYGQQAGQEDPSAEQQPPGQEDDVDSQTQALLGGKQDTGDQLVAIANAEMRRLFKSPNTSYARMWVQDRVKELSR